MCVLNFSIKAVNQLHSAIEKYADTDIAIIKEKSIQRFEFTHELACWLDLDDSNSPYLFDLSIYYELSNPALIEHIDRTGQFLSEEQWFIKAITELFHYTN